MFISQSPTGYYISLHTGIQLNYYNEQEYQLTISLKNGDGLFQDLKQLRTTINTNSKMLFFDNIDIKYLFEFTQQLKIELFQNLQFIGTSQINLGEIISKQQCIHLLDLTNTRQGLVFLKSMASQQSSRYIRFDVRLNMSFTFIESIKYYFGNLDRISLLFYKMLPYKQIILQTQQRNRNELIWKRIESTFEILCDNDPLQSIYCTIIQHHNMELMEMGDFEFWLHKLDEGYFDYEVKKDGKRIGRIRISNYQFDVLGKFYKQIQQGTQLQLIIGIDFSKSSKELHQETTNNQYLQAINAVSKILLDYDHDKRVPLFGFGANPNYMYQYNKHCFPLTGDTNLYEARSLEEISQIYQFAVANVDFNGPTFFNPIIQQTMKQAINDKQNYYVLLLITDGSYMDEDDTIKSVIDATKLPISIIIVGVGYSLDLEQMKKIDGNDGLIDINGRIASRDIVKYVNFNEFKNDQMQLAAELLDELPKQLVEYYKL